MWNGLSQQYEKMSLEDQRTFDRWIKANATFGAVLALGILAMAIAGVNAPGPDAAMSASPNASHVLAAERVAPFTALGSSPQTESVKTVWHRHYPRRNTIRVERN
jgi:hypothetical protein